MAPFPSHKAQGVAQAWDSTTEGRLFSIGGRARGGGVNLRNLGAHRYIMYNETQRHYPATMCGLAHSENEAIRNLWSPMLSSSYTVLT